MKKLLTLLFALLMTAALVACGGTTEAPPEEETDPVEEVEEVEATDGDMAYVLDKGELVIGYTLYAPMNYEDDNGDFVGFDTELARIICEELGVEANFVKINWDTKELELDAKEIDCIWNGMTITDERKENMEVSQPYVKNAQVVVMKAGADYTDTSSLIGKSIAAEKGSAGESVVEADENLAQAEYINKEVQTDCLLEVKSGTVDAAVLDLTLANTMTGEGTNYADLVIVDYLEEEFYGVAFRKGSDLCAEINRIFNELIADGTMSELADKYGLEIAE